MSQSRHNIIIVSLSRRTHNNQDISRTHTQRQITFIGTTVSQAVTKIVRKAKRNTETDRPTDGRTDRSRKIIVKRLLFFFVILSTKTNNTEVFSYQLE